MLPSANSTKLSRFLLFLSLSITVCSLTANPSWTTNSDIKAGKFSLMWLGTLTVCNNGAYVNASYYQTTYSSAFSTAPNVGVAIPSIDIATPPSLMLWKVNLPQSSNQTHIKINMNYVSTAFKTFKISYIAVSGTLSYLKVDYMELAEANINPLVAGAGTRAVQSFITLHITIDSTHTLSIIPYLSGLKITSGSGDRGFALTLGKKDNTSLYFNATCYGTTTVT